MKRKRKLQKPINRRVEIYVGGRCVKVVRDKITLQSAVRESGADVFHGPGAKFRACRRLANVQIRVVWQLMEDLTGGGAPYVETVESNLSDAKMVIRAGVPG